MKNSLQKSLLFFVVVLVLSFSGSSFLVNSTNSTATTTNSTHSSNLTTSASATTTTYTPHSPISFSGDSQFSTNDFTGSGTKSDPYIFENYNITSSVSNGISISSTSASYYIIRNCYFSTPGSFAITIDFSGNLTISNNIINGSDYGIDVEDSSNIIVSNNFVNNSSTDGSYFYNVANGTISNNIIDQSYGFGMYLDDQLVNITFSGNSISHSQTGGIYVYGDLSDFVFVNNDLQFNTIGIKCTGSTASNFQIVDNFIRNSSQYGILFSHVKYVTIIGNTIVNNTYDGIFLDISNNNITISSNLISQNGPGQAPFFASGIEIDVSSANNTIFNNIITNNYDSGIAFRDIESSGSTSSNTTVTNNTISNNGYYGITLQYNGNNTIIYNIISSQQSNEGIGIIGCDNNTIYLNSFIDNYVNPSQISEDPGLTNYFDNGHFGNFYSNYNGTDSNNDGIGDSNYTLSTSLNNDTLPLMHPAYLHVNQTNNKVISEGATSQQLTWQVNSYDAITYSVSLNQTVSTSGTIDTSNWGKSVQTSLDGLSLGSYTVSLSVTDLNTSLTFKIITIVSVIDTTAPVVTVSTTALSYVAGTTGHSISVNATDLHPDSYIVYKDGNQVASGAWNTSADITVSVDGLAVGTYDFTVTAFDSSNNSATVSVIITVTPAPETNSSTSGTGSSTSTGNNAPSFEALTTLLGLVAVFGYETKKRRN